MVQTSLCVFIVSLELSLHELGMPKILDIWGWIAAHETFNTDLRISEKYPLIHNVTYMQMIVL